MFHVASLVLSLPLAASAGAATPRGAYVESRTAAVFAGACHFGGQSTTQGRGAVLAWHFDGGVHRGADLSGVDVAVVLTAAENLAEPGARRSWIYVSDANAPAARDAAVDWLCAGNADLLGAVQGVRSVPLALSIDAQHYTLHSPVGLCLEGSTLPDRACCRMPFNVWYRPFFSIEGAVVGNNDEFRVSDHVVDERWSRPGENAAFTGRFGARATN